MAFWHELTEAQKQEEYKKYIEEVRIKHTEDNPMKYTEFCNEWNDCVFINV